MEQDLMRMGHAFGLVLRDRRRRYKWNRAAMTETISAVVSRDWPPKWVEHYENSGKASVTLSELIIACLALGSPIEKIMFGLDDSVKIVIDPASNHERKLQISGKNLKRFLNGGQCSLNEDTGEVDVGSPTVAIHSDIIRRLAPAIEAQVGAGLVWLPQDLMSRGEDNQWNLEMSLADLVWEDAELVDEVEEMLHQAAYDDFVDNQRD